MRPEEVHPDALEVLAGIDALLPVKQDESIALLASGS